MYAVRTTKRGFTLIEILIVVIILGILAAIVIPQFSNASHDARMSSLASTVQTLRSQVALYKLQHGDTLPDITKTWDALTKASTFNGNNCGPYMQSVPTNPLISSGAPANSSVTDSDGDKTTTGYTTAYVYDLTGGTGKVWGCDDKGNVVAP